VRRRARVPVPVPRPTPGRVSGGLVVMSSTVGAGLRPFPSFHAVVTQACPAWDNPGEGDPVDLAPHGYGRSAVARGSSSNRLSNTAMVSNPEIRRVSQGHPKRRNRRASRAQCCEQTLLPNSLTPMRTPNKQRSQFGSKRSPVRVWAPRPACQLVVSSEFTWCTCFGSGRDRPGSGGAEASADPGHDGRSKCSVKRTGVPEGSHGYPGAALSRVAAVNGRPLKTSAASRRSGSRCRPDRRAG
jgi:hypothetical protein